MPRGKNPYFTPEQDVEIARRYQAGETLRQLAESYGVSDVPVRAALDRQRVERRTVTDYTWQDTPESRAEIIRLWHEEASVKKISRLVRTRDVNISRILREAGIEARLGGQHHRFSKDQVTVLAEEFGAGLSLARLAERHGGNPVTVRDALRRAGVNTTRKRSKFWTPEREQWLVEQRQVGRSLKSIGDEVGYSEASIGIRLRRLLPVPHRQGENHHAWRGGRTKNADGYTLITPTPEEALLCPPMANGYVLENRLVMALALGRPLLKTETVHHIDGDHANAGLGNLQLRQGNHGKGVVFQCQSCGSHDVIAIPIADPAPEGT
ncbi:MAG: hypothetical protein JWM19_835 [Actinomycetia bacterium]|nr:hypothetical protein [Actinomycetes bacterium]